MKRIPKKLNLREDLSMLIDDISTHYKISKSDLVEELLLSVLIPDAFYIQTTLIKNDDHYVKAVEDYLGGRLHAQS